MASRTHNPDSGARRGVACLEAMVQGGPPALLARGFAVARDLLVAPGPVVEDMQAHRCRAVFGGPDSRESLAIELGEIVWSGRVEGCGVCLVRLMRPLPDIESVVPVATAMSVVTAPVAVVNRSRAGAPREGEGLGPDANGLPTWDERGMVVSLAVEESEGAGSRPHQLDLATLWGHIQDEVRQSWQRDGGPLTTSPLMCPAPAAQPRCHAKSLSFDPRKMGIDEALDRWESGPELEGLEGLEGLELCGPPAVTSRKSRFVFTYDFDGPELIFHGPDGPRRIREYGNVVVNRCDPREHEYFLLRFLGKAADGAPVRFEGHYIEDGVQHDFDSKHEGYDLLVAIPCTMNDDQPSQHFSFTVKARSGERTSAYDPAVVNVPIAGSFKQVPPSGG
ncbi:MAG: hypothetical protein K0V04_28560 [Deltaproteobacteria bacterium]|nr:hypothetical protein [Deltaproteobacteria bacterium]